MKIIELRDLPAGDDSNQFRMISVENGYVDFSILRDEMCAHTWACPGEGKTFLKELEAYSYKLKLRLTIPTVLNPKLEKILKDNNYTMREVPYMDDILELWSKW